MARITLLLVYALESSDFPHPMSFFPVLFVEPFSSESRFQETAAISRAVEGCVLGRWRG